MLGHRQMSVEMVRIPPAQSGSCGGGSDSSRWTSIRGGLAHTFTPSSPKSSIPRALRRMMASHMPLPSKFTRKRRELILVALSAGASRRTAAEVASLDPSTLIKWLARGATAPAGTMFARFYDEVVAAEEGSHRPQLLPLREAPPAALRDAWQIVGREFDADVAEPTTT